MCGICGIVHLDRERSVDKHYLKQMTDLITHRGPDDEGYHIDGNVGLGFRRLSIIDLKAGHQPMSNENGDVWIIYNGEFYNHAEIREELISKGHVFKTRADTETIIHLYEQEGINGFLRMNGMFGFAIWDKSKRKLILVRDRLGIKPLYYAIVDNTLIFGSEIKSLLENKSIKAELNENVLKEQIIFRYVAGRETLFKGINKLLPGHLLTVENGKIEVEKYWDVSLHDTDHSLTEKDTFDKLEGLLSDSVRLMLMSDVPLGTFCSGGIDSGLTTAFARKHATAELNTFSIGFHEKQWDETRFAKMVSDRYNTTHHVIRVDNNSYSEIMPKLIWFHDEPLYHPSSSLVFLVSKLAREHVKVVLTGEGSDELFGGYPRFFIIRGYSHVHPVLGPVISPLSKLLACIPSRKLKKIAHFLPLSLCDVAVYNSQYVLPRIVQSVLSDGGNDESINYRLSLLPLNKLSYHNIVESAMFLDLKTYIPAALHRQDKMSMANSLESRVPFLDHRLVEWAMTIPLKYKIRKMENKYIVKKLGEKLLPREAIYRQKVGFGVPVVEWLRDKKGLGRYLDLFHEPEYKQRGYINVETVHQLINEHLAGKCNHCEILWNLINLELWHRIYIDKKAY